MRPASNLQTPIKITITVSFISISLSIYHTNNAITIATPPLQLTLCSPELMFVTLTITPDITQPIASLFISGTLIRHPTSPRSAQYLLPRWSYPFLVPCPVPHPPPPLLPLLPLRAGTCPHLPNCAPTDHLPPLHHYTRSGHQLTLLPACFHSCMVRWWRVRVFCDRVFCERVLSRALCRCNFVDGLRALGQRTGLSVRIRRRAWIIFA